MIRLQHAAKHASPDFDDLPIAARRALNDTSLEDAARHADSVDAQ